MKTSRTMNKLLAAVALLAGVVLAAPATQAQEKGGQRLIQLHAVKTTRDLEALRPGDGVVMSCPKCKTITVTYVETTKGRVKEEKLTREHLCPGCQTKVAIKGTGKTASQELIHICQRCGSKDVMCCVLKKGSGPTAGMDETKK